MRRLLHFVWHKEQHRVIEYKTSHMFIPRYTERMVCRYDIHANRIC